MTEAAQTGPNEVDTFLGTIIVREGFADADTIVKHVQGQLAERERGVFRPFGEYLVDKGVITPDQLRKCLRLQRGDAGRSAKMSAVRDAKAPPPPVSRDKKQKKTRKMMGQYELLGKIGQGAMGTVYLSYDTEQKVDVALKVLPKDLADDPEFVARFSREAELASKVRHPNLVLAYGTGTYKGYHYIAFEYVSGGSLDFHLERTGPLSEKRALLITRDIAHALQAASDHGIVHRDMKPDNIILDRDGTAKLTDLGLSMAYDPGDPRLTAPGMAIGTPFYISPELARGVRDVDVRSDLYSLGATLYHIVTGQVPYESENSVQVMMAHIKEPIPRCREKRPELSQGLEALIMKLMSKKPEERYQSCTEVLQAIERVLEGKMPDEAEPSAKKVEIKENTGGEVRRPRKIGSTDKFKRVTQTGRQSPVGAGAGAGSSSTGKAKSDAKGGTVKKNKASGAGMADLPSKPEIGELDATAEDLTNEEAEPPQLELSDDDFVDEEADADDTDASDETGEDVDESDHDDDSDDEADSDTDEEGDERQGKSRDTDSVAIQRGSAKRSARGATGDRGESVRTSGRRTSKVRPVDEDGDAGTEGAEEEPAKGGGIGKWIAIGFVVLVASAAILAWLMGWFGGKA
ncbi:MAG TPA: serine/threonine-protein kinase [Planctomycetota bacterium]|nr:serine/threonine-protein kinase [Planctomycetota bacterium]